MILIIREGTFLTSYKRVSGWNLTMHMELFLLEVSMKLVFLDILLKLSNYSSTEKEVCLHWANISSTIQTFQLLYLCLNIPIKHCLSCLICSWPCNMTWRLYAFHYLRYSPVFQRRVLDSIKLKEKKYFVFLISIKNVKWQ